MRVVERGGRRGGFTLVELTVVILIIVLLVGLVSAAVLKYMALGPEIQTVNEIRQLEVGLEAFKTKYKLYPPSMIFLSNNLSDYTNTNNVLSQQGYAGTTIGAYSLAYLSAIWPRLNWSRPIDWSGGKGSIPPGGIILEGDQCLVYFLSGPLVGNSDGAGGFLAGTGWATDPTNPTNILNVPTVPPFFEFKANRLAWIQHKSTAQTAPNGFVSYRDPYATPVKFNVYAFFSSGRNQAYNLDCPSLGLGVYLQSNGRGYNANTTQIISAGADFVFGPGGSWPGGANAKFYNTPNGLPVGNGNSNMLQSPQGIIGNGFDDLSNFNSGLLGVP